MRYPKIASLFKRDDNTHGVIVGDFRHPVFGTINPWEVYEKIDGMNIRVTYNADPALIPREDWVVFGGRSDNAVLPARLLPLLYKTFSVDKMEAAFPDASHVILFGEGYGAGIQKGGTYNAEQRFRLFDVVVCEENGPDWWLKREDVENVAHKLNIKTAPYVGLMELNNIVSMVERGMPSYVSKEEGQEHEAEQVVYAEGIVARPVEHMFFRNGERVMWKLKTKDFK